MRTMFLFIALFVTACQGDDGVPPVPDDYAYTARDVVHPLMIGYCRKFRRCDNPDMDVPPCTDQLEARACADADCDAPATSETVDAALDCMDVMQAMACGSEVGGSDMPRCFTGLMGGIPDRVNPLASGNPAH